MKWVGIVVAVVAAVIAAFMVLKLSGGSEQKARQVQVSEQAESDLDVVNVYVAANYIPIGSVIEENMLTVQPWPKHLLVEGFVVGQEKGRTLVGKIARASFQALEPIMDNKVVNPDDPNYLAGELPKGKRVVTMRTDEISGVAGFVFPGDRVDVLINHRVLKKGVSARDIETLPEDQVYETVSERLLGNIRVLAVDQRSTGGVDKENGIIIPKSVSLEVTPEDAQRIALARQLGQMTLALRSLKDKETMETVAITRQSDLSQFDVSSVTSRSANAPVKVVRGVESETLEVDNPNQADDNDFITGE